ncbi:MAG: hypothetical protein COV99_03665 [Bacteroidetes bacterium CG12_big_fil_rev_8_21_14_0_65_60_17]|nr:MAG: hypothetical protein COV99_03665 [Bacteroidetes bacterium CG12_big_fil_rev_8_21_14_0_65_60_17]
MSTIASFETIEDVRADFHRIVTPLEFERAATVVEAYQKQFNPVYARYDTGRFVPVEVFRHARIATFPPEHTAMIFRSSGTGGVGRRAEHHVRDLDVYARATRAGFQHVYGRGSHLLLALVPAYATDSSLVWMLKNLIKEIGAPGSRMLTEARTEILEAVRVASPDHPPVLFGAAFGLLDLVEEGRLPLPAGSVVIETGGMKTHRRAISRRDMHRTLADGFDLPLTAIHSEYGMCELMSQCYTKATGTSDVNEWFHAPPWVRLDVHRPDMPDTPCDEGEEGVLVVTDLANMYSLSFIRTQDRAIRRGPAVSILGREPGAHLRGCNFLFDHDS